VIILDGGLINNYLRWYHLKNHDKVGGLSRFFG
jgi:hypothetical protein